MIVYYGHQFDPERSRVWINGYEASDPQGVEITYHFWRLLPTAFKPGIEGWIRWGEEVRYGSVTCVLFRKNDPLLSSFNWAHQPVVDRRFLVRVSP